jgi:radical SAM superfamily enzyme YgiQ (UPF0313 family)
MRLLHARLPCRKIYPCGPVYLADYLHKKTDVEQRIIDLAVVDKERRKKFLRREVEAFDPDIIAFSWRDIQIFSPDHGDPSLENAFRFYYSPNPLVKARAALAGIASILEYHSRIKENLGYIQEVAGWYEGRVVVGGPAVSVFPEHVIRRLREGILGVVGEGEHVLAKVIAGAENRDLLDERVVFRQGNRVFRGEKERAVNVEELGPVDYEYISEIFPQLKEYLREYVGVQTKRGCLHRCMYCLYPYIEGKVVRCRRPGDVAAEISQLHHSFGVKRIWFVDSQFIPGKTYVPGCIETLDAVVDEKVDIEWGGYIRIENMTRALARKMLQSGIMQFELSIASGSQRVIDFLTLDYKIRDIFRACEKIKDAGHEDQRILLNFSLNAPTETRESLLESVAAYKKIRSVFGEEHVNPVIFFLGIQPHTRLEKYAIENKILPRNYDPLSLSPRSIRKLIYNPPPLDKLIARACLRAWEEVDREQVGRYVMETLERELNGGE